MEGTPLIGGIEILPADLTEITRLYESGLYVQSCERARALGSFEQWRGTAAQLIAGRIAMNVGAPELSRRLHLKAWRGARSNPEAAYYRALDLLHHSPLRGWRFVSSLPAFPNATPLERADLLTARANALTIFRDFERAAAELDEAEALAGDHPWVWVQRASLLQAQDSYEAALEAAREALARRAWFRPAVQVTAELLQLLCRDEEALGFLSDASRRIESSGVVAQLAVLQSELGLHAEALASWERVRELSPLMEAARERAWQARISDARYQCGDETGAAAAAALAKNPFFDKIAERLAAGNRDARRVLLPVPFVRQHHMTCTPATISAISRFLGEPIDHLALAAAICYDGTPDHVERAWMEEHGWRVREFRLTWDAAVSLLDRGIPFTVGTVETQSGHLQAVVGYDERRGTLLIRDPYLRTHGEAIADAFIERYASSGPRAAVMLPEHRAAEIDDLELPESELYDHRHRLSRALHEHNRTEAERSCMALENAGAPGRRLAIEARRALAAYDANLPRLLAATEEMLALFPDDTNMLLAKLSLLRELAQRAEYHEFLRTQAQADVTDPIFWREWAEELSQDAREHATARRHLLRALRFRPTDAETLAALANLLWAQRGFEQATELYRFAACLRDKTDGFSRSYLIAARHVRATDAALHMLQRRFDAFGGQSSQPARLLFSALMLLDRSTEAFERLETALAARPDDGELLLFAADAFARHGNPERGAELLARAEKRSARAAWLRTAALLADYRCDLPRSLALWSEVLLEQPLAADAHRAVTRLIGETRGQAAALEHLRAACRRFPHYIPLQRLGVEWARAWSTESAEPELRSLLALNPNDAWARRELALALAAERKFEEAETELAFAEKLAPHAPETFAVRAEIASRAGRMAEAREAAMAALRLSVDFSAAMEQLFASSVSFEEKRAAADFIRQELVRQVVFGDGLLSYRQSAFPLLKPDELLAHLRDAHRSRPDLWHAWSALSGQLADMGRLDEALEVAAQAVERFPLLPRLWYDLAQVRLTRGEPQEEIRPLQRALILSPGWGLASRGLAGAHQRLGRYDEACRILEQAVAAAPLDPLNYGALSEALWRLDRKEESQERLEHALRLEPGYDWAWGVLRDRFPQGAGENRAVTLARELTSLRPGELRSWLTLAQMLPDSALEERLAALDRAAALDPANEDAWDVRAMLLAEAGRFDEAIQACRPPAWQTAGLPLSLQGRRIWIEMMQGNIQAAIGQMRELLDKSPDYYWGWTRLCEWCSYTGAHDLARSAAKQMARLAPRSAYPLGHIADVQLKLRDSDEAMKTLRRALAIDPAYEFAANQILQLQLDQRDFDGAETTLAHFQTHLPGPPALAAEARLRCRQDRIPEAAEARLRCRQDRIPEAAEALRKLCFVPESETGHLNAAAQAFGSAHRPRESERVLAACLEEPGANPEVGAWWVRRFTERGAWKERSRLYELDPASPLGVKARIAYIEACAAHRDPAFLRGLMRRESETLRRHPQTWGMVGYALVHRKRYQEVVRWMADWRNRDGLRPWMLSNLCVALRELGRDAEAAEVNQAAMALPRDGTTPQHQVWAACDAALAGDVNAASRLLAETRSAELGPFLQARRALAAGIVEVQTAREEERMNVFEAQMAILRRSDFSGAFADRMMKPLYRRGVEMMAAAAGTRPSRRALQPPQQAHSTRPAADSGSGVRVLWIVLMLLGVLVRTCSPSFPPPQSAHRETNTPPALSTPREGQRLDPGRAFESVPSELRLDTPQRQQPQYQLLPPTPNPRNPFQPPPVSQRTRRF